MSRADLTVIGSESVEHIEHDSDVQPGQWWWYYKDGVPGVDLQPVDEDDGESENDCEVDEDGSPVLVCVTVVGSNFVEVMSVYRRSDRHHSATWYDYFSAADDASAHIRKKQDEYRGEVERLLGEVHEITRRLGVSRQAQLPEQNTQALVVRGERTGYDEYKNALVKAKTKDIPALYSEIRQANEALADWLKAPTLPMSAAITDQQEIVNRIQRKIFSVELYAGLQEKVVQVADGEPAAMGDKLHLMQRRHYMDEECLARYETGGMSFSNVREFDAWLARPDNRDRIFPFPRCMVAFRVRRHSKEFSGDSLEEFIRFQRDKFDDESTFLYIRNGEQLYCLESAIDFGEKLFPDLEHSVFSSGQQIYACKEGLGFHFMTEGEWLVRTADLDRKDAEWEAACQSWREARESWEMLSKAKQKTTKKPSYFGPHRPTDYYSVRDHEPFTPENLYYDDIVEYMKRQAEEYNRVSLIIQGLFDRSPILHPHPKVMTWTQEGFRAAIELHYDMSQALTGGAPPDFDAYREKLNESIGVGSKTVGQAAVYARFVREQKEEQKYTRRHDYGSGPGVVAEIAEWKPRARMAVFRWNQNTQLDWGVKSPTKPRRFDVAADELLNIDAYTPGDFRQFYDDPRTRAEYAKWAYHLLLAEEYYAGNVDDRGRPQTKAVAETCEVCKQTWYRTHRCPGRPVRTKRKAKR